MCSNKANCNGQNREEALTAQLEEYINVYKAKRSKTEEFLQNLLFNLNYIQYKVLELQFIINE